MGVDAKRMLWLVPNHPALVLYAGLVMLILERNREREPSREKDRENRREGG